MTLLVAVLVRSARGTLTKPHLVARRFQAVGFAVLSRELHFLDSGHPPTCFALVLARLCRLLRRHVGPCDECQIVSVSRVWIVLGKMSLHKVHTSSLPVLVQVPPVSTCFLVLCQEAALRSGHFGNTEPLHFRNVMKNRRQRHPWKVSWNPPLLNTS